MATHIISVSAGVFFMFVNIIIVVTGIIIMLVNIFIVSVGIIKGFCPAQKETAVFRQS
jgi:hypothetical protein